MAETRRYELDGIVVDIPIYYDDQAKMYIEDYPDFIENPIWTASGYRVLFSGTDACKHAEETNQGGCSDCASCKFYESAAEHTWFGMCKHKKNNKAKFDPKKEA